LRLTRTHQPVYFSNSFPLLQLQPLPRIAYAEETLSAVANVESLQNFSQSDWDDYNNNVVLPSADPDRPHGAYAVAARRRRKSGCPFQAVAATAP
jgi:hypothetical protein